MSYGPPPRSGVPKAIIAVIVGCGSCLVLSVVAAVLMFNAVMATPRFALGKASALQAMKRYPEAEALLVAAVKRSPNDASLLNNLAWTYYLDGKYAEGEPFIALALKHSSNPNYIDTQAHIFLGLKRYAEAETQFKAGLKGNPGMAESHDGLGQVYEHRGKLDMALNEYQSALALDPNIEGAQSRVDRVEERIRIEKRDGK